jgi:hypothetical protein
LQHAESTESYQTRRKASSQGTQAQEAPQMSWLRFAAQDGYILHPSIMRSLLLCSWTVAARSIMKLAPEEGGVAGDTGSAVHAAAAAFHRGSSVMEALAAMAARKAEFPLADMGDAAAMFVQYAADVRNSGAQMALVEEPIAFDIAPADGDPTGMPIHVEGRVDQVRRHADGVVRTWDIKSSKKDPLDVLHSSTLQMAAYTVGASIKLGIDVQPGGIIAVRRYRGDPSHSQVFYSHAWTLADCEHILEPVRRAVADVRRGRVHHLPGELCKYCHLRSPDVCLPKLKDAKREYAKSLL